MVSRSTVSCGSRNLPPARSKENAAKMKRSSQATTRKPPTPSDDHREIDDWIRRVMPDLHPVVKRIDELIRENVPGLQYAVKWRRAYYGIPELGWIIEMVAYDVSVNVVFFGGAVFESPPPLGSGEARYVKVTDLESIDEPAMLRWLEQAARVPGWQ
jgi:hypothetical protein